MWFESDITEQLSHGEQCRHCCVLLLYRGCRTCHHGGPVTGSGGAAADSPMYWKGGRASRPSWGTSQVSLPLTLGCVCDASNDCAHKAVPVDVCVMNCACLCGMGLCSPCLCHPSWGEQPCKELYIPCQLGPQLWVPYWSPSLCPHSVESGAMAAACLVPGED